MCNMYQTPVPFKFVNGHVYNIIVVNYAHIKVTKSSHEKKQVTLMLTIFVDSVARVALLLIFKAVSDTKC